jgi:hypothetical protein
LTRTKSPVVHSILRQRVKGAKDLSLIRRLSHPFDREQMNHVHVRVLVKKAFMYCIGRVSWRLNSYSCPFRSSFWFLKGINDIRVFWCLAYHLHVLWSLLCRLSYFLVSGLSSTLFFLASDLSSACYLVFGLSSACICCLDNFLPRCLVFVYHLPNSLVSGISSVLFSDVWHIICSIF